MMNLSMDDADREAFFEDARKAAQREWEQDNSNAQALVKWGGALLELAHSRQGDEAIKLIEQAIGKLRQAVQIDPQRPEAEWCLGNAYTSLGFLCNSKTRAQQHFTDAAGSFKKCLKLDPGNDMYKKALEMTDKAPEYYDEIYQQIQQQQQLSQGVDEFGGGGKGKAAVGSDFWWDIAGWAVLSVIVVGALASMRNAAPAPA